MIDDNEYNVLIEEELYTNDFDDVKSSIEEDKTETESDIQFE